MCYENIKKVMSVAATFAICLMFSYCGGKKAPEWVTKGAAAFPQDEGKKLYGVGVASASPNVAMTRERCTTRSRAEIAKIVNTYVASLVKDFMEEHKDYFNPDAAGSNEFTQSVAKSVADATLVGSQIIDWYPEGPEYDEGENVFCLAVLNVDTVLSSYAEKAKQAIREQHRAVMKERAEEALNALDQQLEKKRQTEKQMMGQ